MPNRLKSSAASSMASGARHDVGNAIDCLIVCSPTCPIQNRACPIKICKCFIRKTSLWWNFCTFCSRCWRCFCSCACFPVVCVGLACFACCCCSSFYRRTKWRDMPVASSKLAVVSWPGTRQSAQGRHGLVDTGACAGAWFICINFACGLRQFTTL